MGLPPPVNLEPETEQDNDDALDTPPTVTPDEPEIVEPKSRGRGRPPKNATTAPKRTAAKKAADAKALGKQIVGIHILASMATGLPELAINDDEGERLADAIQAVADEYGLNFSGKTGAAIQLFAAAGMVYAPRFIRIKMRMDKEQKAKQLAGGENGPSADS